MQLYVKKHPNPQTLISKVYTSTQPEGYELATELEVSDWIHEQIMAGWEPTFPDLSIEKQFEIVKQQRDTYRDQSLFLKSSLDEANRLLVALESDKTQLAAQLATATMTIKEYEDAIWDRTLINPSAWWRRFGNSIVDVSAFALKNQPIAELLLVLQERIEAREKDPSILISLRSERLVGGVRHLLESKVISQELHDYILSDSRKDEQ